MEDYKYGLKTTRSANSARVIEKATVAQAAVGIAPINLLDEPQAAVNTPIIIENLADAQALFEKCSNPAYTLWQTYFASLKKYKVAPIVLVNVLDPDNPQHVTAVGSKDYTLEKGSVNIKDEGILLDSIIVTKAAGDTPAKINEDYVTSFDSSGYVDVAVTTTGSLSGESTIKIGYTKLNPDGVKAADIIGGVDENEKRSGIEVLDEVYMMHNIVPAIISAPKYSKDPAVATALESKAELVGDLLNATAVVDLECETTKKIQDAKTAKDKLGVFGRQTVICWPKVVMAGYEIYASAEYSAHMQYAMMQNAGIPTSTDNTEAMIEGICTEDGERKLYTEKQCANYLMQYGIVSYKYQNMWKTIGENSAAFPDEAAQNQKSIKGVAICNYLENRFKTDYAYQIGRDTKPAAIKSIVNDFNYMLSKMVPDYLAGGEMEFREDENPIEQIQEGYSKFRVHYADYPTTKGMDAEFVWDVSDLEKAFYGGDNE